jgi:uridine kinase
VDAGCHTFAELVDIALAAPGPVRLVGVDGCGGAGKSTFAARLARAAGDVPVVHTDDFASFEEPTQWWPRFGRDVVAPLIAGEPVSFAPYDWVARRPSGSLVTVPPAPLVVIEGVGALRQAWRDRLALRVWVETPRGLRLERGLARDGAHMASFWEWWMAAEDDYVAAERPEIGADVVVDGAPDPAPPDPEREFVALSAPRAAGSPRGRR